MLRRFRSTPAPTDLEILDELYERHYDEFASYAEDAGERASKILVPVDISGVADELGVDPDVVFGRLYYDLENRYGYQRDGGTKVVFFTIRAGSDEHCVNFPYLASVVADLRERKRKYETATGISLFSLGVAVASLVISIGL